MEEEAQAGVVVALWDYGRPLERLLSFKYLMRLLTATDDNWKAIIENLRKTRKS